MTDYINKCFDFIWRHNSYRATKLTKLLLDYLCLSLIIITDQSHCYFTRLKLSRDSQKPKIKRVFQFLCGIVDGGTNRARPSRPILKIAKMALFNPCMKFEIFWGQMNLFGVLSKCHFETLSKICLRLCPSANPSG